MERDQEGDATGALEVPDVPEQSARRRYGDAVAVAVGRAAVLHARRRDLAVGRAGRGDPERRVRVQETTPRRSRRWTARSAPTCARRSRPRVCGVFDEDVGQRDAADHLEHARRSQVADDLNAFKIRTPPGELWVDLFKSLGASPTPINFSEVYTALQTKVVDGQENPSAVIETARLFEVQKYLSVTNHMWSAFRFLANGDAWKAFRRTFKTSSTRNAAKYALSSGARRRSSTARWPTSFAARGWPSTGGCKRIPPTRLSGSTRSARPSSATRRGRLLGQTSGRLA